MDEPTDPPTDAMRRELAWSLAFLGQAREQMDRATMALVIRELEEANAASVGLAVDEYRDSQLALTRLELGFNMSMDEFIAVYIEGTAEVTNGRVTTRLPLTPATP
jgi:adenylylsulfate kinase-like enzyme